MIEKKIYYHNGSDYIEINPLDIIDGTPLEETIDDTLDNGALIIKNGFESFLELWTSIKIESGNLSKCFLVADIDTARDKTIKVQYTHTITLIEPTKYLEKIYCPSMSFTNKNDTLLGQFRKALRNAEILEIGASPRFIISSALTAKLLNEPSRDFFFEKSTLREILDGILGVIDCRVEIYEITDFNNIVIDYYDINARGKLITINDVIDEKQTSNIEYLGSDIEAYGENAFSGSRSPIYHPSPNGWDTFKTNEVTLNTNNAVMSTAFPIEEIKEFIIKCSFNITIAGGIDYTSTVYNNHNIVSNVVDSESYEILDNFNESAPVIPYKSNNLYKDNTIFYTRGEQRVQFENKTHLFFTTQNIVAAIRNAIWNSGIIEQILINEQIPFTKAEILQYIEVNLLSFSVLNTLFRAKYIPYIDAHTRISKSNYSKVPSTLIDNQSDKTIDLERYGDNLSSTINRLGNKTLTIGKIHYDINDVFEVQDYTADNYIVTKRTLALYNHHIKAHYELTKDFASVNERIGIDRAKRIYNIPLENFIRDILIKEYVIASFDGANENTGLTELFMRVFSPSSEKLSITNALIQTGWYVDDGSTLEYSDWLELSVAPYSMATSLHFRFKFIDNFSAGMSTENQVIGGKKQVPNPYVKTTGEKNIGEHDRVRIMLINDKLATRSELYNDIKQLPKTNISWYSNALKLIDKTFRVEKDTFEHMSYVYQLEVLSNDPNIIIGKSIAKLHPLVNDNDVSYELKVYTSTETYSRNDTKAKGTVNNDITYTYVDNTLSIIDTEYPYEPAYLPNAKSWCIADNLGNILVAVNKVEEAIINNSVRFNHKTSGN